MSASIVRPRGAPFGAMRACVAIVPLLVAGLAFQLGGAVAATPRSIALGEPTGVDTIAHAPASVPRDYVITPNGFFHPSCVQRIESDETLEANGAIVRADGTMRRVPECAYPHYAADGTRIARDDVPPLQAMYAGLSTPPQINGWVAYASYVLPSTNAALFIRADMSVPNPPTIHSGQVDYFFPGFEDLEAVQTIVQPVLGWNAFNDNGWTIASWNCCLNGETWHSPPIAVQAGVTLEGRVTGSNCTGSVCTDWTIVTSDPANSHDTTLNTSGYGQVFDWVFGAVLEAYGISQCGELPASGVEEFSRITVRALRPSASGGAGQGPAWDPTIIPSSPNCGYSVTPHPQINSPQITIGY